MTSITQQYEPPTARLKVVAPDGDVTFHDLVSGEMWLIGSGSSCGLSLPADEAAGMHCTLTFAGGRIHVRDWNTTQGTFVDGEKIAAETVLEPGMELGIGSYRIELADVVRTADAAATEAVDTVDGLLREADDSDRTAAEADSSSDAADRPQQPAAEIGRTHRGDWPDDSAGYDLESFDDDTLDLLKAEVEFLQTELADRDARLAELAGLADLDGSFVDAAGPDDSPEVEGLVARLEQLLDELERCDERMSTMADLLRTAEDAREAELEERRQVEAWIGEIERRLSEREAERRAEQGVLQQTVADLTKQLQRAEQQLDQAAAGGDASADRDNYLTQMRGDYAALEERLKQAEDERVRLSERLEAIDADGTEARTRAAIEESLREERLAMAQERTAISQERAAFAREKSEFDRLREQLESESQKLEGSSDSADHRIRAFREHLREIHDTERTTDTTPGLSARIGKIWRRLEGRPLDTD